MSSLYEINEKLLAFEFQIDEETGEILNADELDQLEMERDEKIENIGLWIKDLLAEAEAIKAEEKALSERRKAKENKAERLKNYLMQSLGGSKFETPRLRISYRKSEAVNVLDEEVIPTRFFKVKTEIKKADIKQALKAGEEIEGVELIENQSMQIK